MDAYGSGSEKMAVNFGHGNGHLDLIQGRGFII
jgi:hypothetical protein